MVTSVLAAGGTYEKYKDTFEGLDACCVSKGSFYATQKVVITETNTVFTERLKVSVRECVRLLREGKFKRIGEDSRHCQVSFFSRIILSLYLKKP
jgi:hypothetical protein